MPELDAERRERLAEQFAAMEPGWDAVKDCEPGQIGWGARQGYLSVAQHKADALAPLVAGWLADDTAVCTTCQHRGGDDQPAQHPGCAAALGRIRSAALREAAEEMPGIERHLFRDWLRDRADRIGGGDDA